jgi:hypothetical protein
MLTQLTTVKARLGLTVTDYDGLLTNAIEAISVRFDRECNRTFARSVNTTHEFDGGELELRPACFPIESVTKFEVKASETEGWLEQNGVEFLIRRQCVISLYSPLSSLLASLSSLPSFCLGRVTYTGGYVLPGTTPGAGQTALPNDLEQAAVEQVAYWYRNRDKLGLVRIWPHGGTYEGFAQLDLLLEVKAVLKNYERWDV